MTGSGYTDHCTRCLAGKHVDNNPGDRKSKCRGKMVPIGAEYRAGSFRISYRCSRCGTRKTVGAASGDNTALLMALAMMPARKIRPIAGRRQRSQRRKPA